MKWCDKCEWPRSCERDGCWLEEEKRDAELALDEPRSEPEPEPSTESVRRARPRRHFYHKRFIR